MRCGIMSTQDSPANVVGRDVGFAAQVEEVTISGEVMEIFSMIVVNYFFIRDESGENFVVTDRTLPAKGEKIKVKGSAQESFLSVQRPPLSS